jgi:outer membrane protein assembly factor BamB
MSKIKFLIVFLILFTGCSLDNKTGIWGDKKKERARIADLEDKQNQVLQTNKIFSSENIYSEEVNLVKNLVLLSPKQNPFWVMPGLNHQNFLGNIYLSGVESIYLKKKIGKTAKSFSLIPTSLLFYNNSIMLSDSKGTIFSVSPTGKTIWKKNIYKKNYKRIYKNLSITVYKNNIYISDNIGFIYSLDATTGKINWIKNHGIPLKSKIKVFKDKIFLINQDNRILSLNINDGSVIWDIRSIAPFIKSQSLLSLAISKKDDVIASTSAGDLFRINSATGEIYWSLSTLGSTLEHANDFFKSSDIVINKDNIYFSTLESFSSYNLSNGYINWTHNLNCISTPIISNNYVFVVSENGFLVIIDDKNGEIISSTNILKVLKRKHQSTIVTGFIMGSNKIYAVTLNGFLIISSASTGKVESFKKIGGEIVSPPIIADGKLFIYTSGSKLLSFN